MGLFERNEFDYKCEQLEEAVPPDVLIELCKKGKVEIKDLFISDITRQYLEFVQSMEETDYDNVSNFLVYASTLLELKSSALLPKMEFEEPPEEIPAEDLFLMRLTEYSILKDASEKLQEREILNRFYRDPEFSDNDFNIIIKNYDMTKMINAFSMLLEQQEYSAKEEEPKTIQKERFSVADRVVEIVEAVRALKIVNLSSLFEPDYTKIEVINTFLALLEILKQQIATAEQIDRHGDIIIKYAPLTDNFNLEQQEVLLKDVDGYN